MTGVGLVSVTEVEGATATAGGFRKFLRNPLVIASLVVLLGFVATAILSLLLPLTPNRVVLGLTNAPPFTSEFVLGGDRYGRDILSRLIVSAPGALRAAAIVVIVSVLTGVAAGLVAGYAGRIWDSAFSWVFSLMQAMPVIIILIALYTVVGSSQVIALLVLGVLVSPLFYWLTRRLTRNVRNELYVDAARVSGLSAPRIVGRHVLSVILAPIIIAASFLAGGAVAIQAGLEFLGLGDPSTASWGEMLLDAFVNVYRAPWQLIWPALVLGLVMAAFVLLGNALRDALQGAQPALRRRPVTAVAARASVAGKENPHLLEIAHLGVGYESGGVVTKVVDDVSLYVDQGETVGLVGESGSGKTQTVFAALGLLPDSAIVTGGSIRLDGRELIGCTERELARVRGTQIGYVPQEPSSNLDPSFTVGSQLVYGIRAQSGVSKREARALALSMLDQVGIRDPLRTFRSYPHEISGGMGQRVLIAGAVACRPRLLIADEPTTALDVTVQAEVLDLLREIQAGMGMGVLIVTHNFGVVADICDRVAVMRVGKLVEEGSVASVFRDPEHDYTKMLLASILDDAEPRGELTKRSARG
jgi:peptide/nickel transport system permease protein